MQKALFGLPLRQAAGVEAGLLKLARLARPARDFSIMCRRQNGPPVSIPQLLSAGALRLLVDMTGTKAMVEGDWSVRKHDLSRPGRFQAELADTNDQGNDARHLGHATRGSTIAHYSDRSNDLGRIPARHADRFGRHSLEVWAERPALTCALSRMRTQYQRLPASRPLSVCHGP